MWANEQNKPPGAAAGSDDGLHERLLDLLQRLIKKKHVKHAVVAVERGDGSLRWIGAAGTANADGTPMRDDTPFWIASVTKLFIATAILKLYEQGRLSIDDTMDKYLPQSMIGGLHRTGDGLDHTGEITLRHLLGHASGLPDYIIIHDKGGKSLFDRVLGEGDRSWSIEESMQIVRAVNRPLFPPQPLQAKNKKVSYSDTNFQLLIAVIEAVTAKPIHTAFEEMIYKPLDLKQTFHPGTLPAGPAAPTATVWYRDQPLDHLSGAMRSFGDLNSTANDLLAFMRALIQGKLFARPDTLKLMRDNWNRFGFSFSPVGPGWPMQYSLGMMRFQMPRIFTPFRPIPELIGHTGACGSWLFYCPPLDLYLAGTVSQLTAAAVPFQFLPKLLNFLLKHLR